jgi:hypothetical protein
MKIIQGFACLTYIKKKNFNNFKRLFCSRSPLILSHCAQNLNHYADGTHLIGEDIW